MWPSESNTLPARITRWLVLLTLLVSSNSYALSTHTLKRGDWSLISIPADPGTSGTVQQLFADDLPASSYGPTGEWLIFAFDATDNAYRTLSLSDRLEAGAGYWIIQNVVDSVELDLPDSLTAPTGTTTPGCPDNNLCTTVPVIGSASAVQWNLLGASVDTPTNVSDTRFDLAGGTCATGCGLADAISAGLVGNPPYRYTGTAYEAITETSILQPWDGFWIPVLANATFSWNVPVGDDNNPASPLTPAEQDAARLLMQASFGPTDTDINSVIDLGGPAAWVDAQLALPVERHLPIVKQLFPDTEDDQEGRYEAFWRRALRANDQLRQRVAFALSQILVISDSRDSIKEHGNLAAAYYDILLNNAFGNYRTLLQQVTLSPAMGLYLSMIGNDKPNAETGLRADENYARELMQLFSIGLVNLNIDGTEQPGSTTYTQSDVENLARVFTGWYWDVEQWRRNSRYGWRPNRVTLERPMIVFPEHHDTDAKTFLGNSLPAGQTAESELTAVLDIIFAHPNVAPFVSQQLIKRLVTSNPSRNYVRRVAQVFNNNGDGVRGDMAAVIKAILLDQEARTASTSNRTDYGKLREPLLRYAHLLRAFRVTDPIKIRRWMTRQVPQLAPLTAPSVFNFYSPSYAPPGPISDANLTAPEFQINSGSSLNTANSTMMIVAQKGEIKGVPVRLNLQREIQLLDNPAALINHLDRILTAGRLTSASRQTLTEYLEGNRGEIDDDQLIRDVVGLVATSTEYAIQR